MQSERDQFSRLTDTRAFALYPTPGIALSVFLMIVSRLGSLHALEQDRSRPGWLRRLGTPLASADTIGRVFSELQVESLRAAVHAVYQRFKRNKALGPFQGHDVLILDGHETHASFRRCCRGCLERRLSDGRIQYYHRLVLAMIAAQPLPFLLDLEPQQKGEDEVACATRFLQCLLGTYPRAFDLVSADGLYVWATRVPLLLSHHKHVLFVLKDERRDLIKDVRGILRGSSPANRSGEGARASDLGRRGSDDVDGVRTGSGRAFGRDADRVPAAGSAGKTVQTEWIWMTTVPQVETSSAQIVELGHGCWAIENRAFRELATYWHADHVYRHQPRAIEAFWLMVLLTLNLFRALYTLNLKPSFRDRHTQIYIASQFAADLAIHGPAP